MSDHLPLQLQVFELAAARRGYYFDRQENGRYEDHFLQEAWEIYVLIDLERLARRNQP